MSDIDDDVDWVKYLMITIPEPPLLPTPPKYDEPPPPEPVFGAPFPPSPEAIAFQPTFIPPIPANPALPSEPPYPHPPPPPPKPPSAPYPT